MGNVLIEQYDITSPVLTNNQEIAFLSDIHGESLLLDRIIATLKELRISTLLIGGDLIDYGNNYEKNESIKELLQELAKNVRIFVTFGNHDTQDFDGKRWFMSENLSFWDDLSLVDNIYVANLPKEKPTITKWPLNDEVDVCALNLTTAHYLNKEPCEEFRDFLEMLESFDVNLKKFNILLCHSPMNIARSDVIDDFLSYLKQYNLILSGHIHAGFIPKCLRRNTWGGGLVGPYGILLPSYAYGLNEHNGVFTLTSGGAVKLADSSKPSLVKHSPLVDKMLRSVYPPEIEILRLRHGDANKIVKVLSKTH